MAQIQINGQQCSIEPGQSILAVAKRHNVELPHLCEHQLDQLEHANPHVCQLTQVDLTHQGETKSVLACRTLAEDGMVVNSQTTALQAQRKQILEQVLSDHFADCEAPCQSACPAGVDVQSYLHHIARGDHQQAVKVIKQTLPMPLSIGRVCPAFCEAECRRGAVDEPVAIRQLKRHAADIDLNALEAYVPPKAPDNGRSVMIVGSGPAGLTAGYYLSNQGYRVDIIESMPKAGGWLRYGIPEYRLPKDILDKEIELMCRNGMKIHTNTRVGQERNLNELVEEYDAVCLAVGAQKAVPLDYPGSDLAGCYLGVDYLRDRAQQSKLSVGRKVAVIGGGNTAIDCARTAVREGAEVTLIYRRDKASMPAEPYEIEEAEQEGVNFHFLTNPLKNQADANGRVSQVTFEVMALGEPDASGRRSPKATGEEFTQEFDTVIAAVSQQTDLDFLYQPGHHLTQGELSLSRWQTFIGCEQTMSSGVEKLFVIGDSRRGPSTAVEAVADGRVAADAIDRYLTQGLSCELYRRPYNSRKARKLKDLSTEIYAGTAVESRIKMPHLELGQRLASFNEVELGFSDDTAMAEAKRCLECACQVNRECSLRDYATSHQVDWQTLEVQEARQHVKDDSAPFIEFDANRCISCGACVQACHGQAGHQAISFEAGSFNADPDGGQRFAPRAGFSASMADSDCVQCGTCVQVCPTGALVASRHKRQGLTPTPNKAETVCSYCGVGCRIELEVDQHTNQIIQVHGVEDKGVNGHSLCVKGRYGFDFVGSDQRLTHPLIRKDGELVPVSWGEAINAASQGLADLKAKHGGRALAAFASAKATNEDNYLIQKLVRSVLGSNNIDHCARLCHASTVSGLYDSLGSGAMTNDIADIVNADLVFVIGSDTTVAHPIIAAKIREAVRRHNTRLVVADPKNVDIMLDAHLSLRHAPGSDVLLLNGLMQELIKRNALDQDYLDSKAEGLQATLAELTSDAYSLDVVAKDTGLSLEQLTALADEFERSERVMLVYAMGITQHTTGHDNVLSLANLAILTGNIGRSGSGILPLRGQSNVQGACDVGGLPDYYPGYQKVNNPDIKAKFEALWDCQLDDKPGLTVTEVIPALAKGEVKGLYVMGENPVLSDPDQAHVIEALQKAELLIVQDIFLTETAQMADIVLPAYAFAEKCGHVTNTERRVQPLSAAVKAPGSALPDWQIVQLIANGLGADWRYADERQIWSEINQVTPSYRGIEWQRLREGGDSQKGIQWPCPDAQHPGTPILHVGGVVRGKAKLHPVNYRLPAELPCEEYPLVLSTHRQLQQFHTGTMTRKTEGLDQLAQAQVMVSVQDAERLGLKNSQSVRLVSRRGAIETKAFVTKRAQPGVVFVPFHFVEAAANALTHAEVDPVAKIPEFKVSSVRIEPL
ncbi:formate dehydrogenase subunit alpha [Paraferrimonas sedimenticola]|uniref:Formate dehydrogenase subunit alpha n=1 Tax=Paraferrimonas sedimenticola TaxID=375674 RepID=A0AA37RTM6_9GAMM|nr:formate dehydrogenase subunit alpha [Paraferrimonas sedimenticola]GLP95465.1 formate dehydrogenase subunit alpha [Paraferrimonas sedimenticola]